ncbi:hypothetical protein SELMODRAFT_425404 [Selaginella moellendorffii]|uniref:FAF domain-containing protein n=1 Tax=Selaginella moellendorffii TaxID=88036 RepID=D8ST02_SELML|nr:hypothetical protein SELMODRAFT_425404 [Selaginella moellendorffii]
MDPSEQLQLQRRHSGANAGRNLLGDEDLCSSCESSSESGAAKIFPPPLTILAGDCSYSRFPYCMPRWGLRPIRRKGRFLLQEVRVPRQLMFHSVRKNGRLVLMLLLHHDRIEDELPCDHPIAAATAGDQEEEEESDSSFISGSLSASSSNSSSSSWNLKDLGELSLKDLREEEEARARTDSNLKSVVVIKDGVVKFPYGNPLKNTNVPKTSTFPEQSSSTLAKRSSMDDLLVANLCGKASGSAWKGSDLGSFQSISHWTH